MKTDIKHLIPEQHRSLVEAVPKGVLRSAVHDALLLGACCGSLACLLIPHGWIPVFYAVLLVFQRIWLWRGDKRSDSKVAELGSRGLAWKEHVPWY